MPTSHIFHLGREKELCFAELLTFYPKSKNLNGSALVEEEINPKIINRLGGTIKISEVRKELPASMPISFSETITKELEQLLPKSGKFRYGISIYPEQAGLLKKLLSSSKTHFKEKGVSSRYLNRDQKNLLSIESANCTELNLVFTKEKIYLTHTIAVQDIASYGYRDYDRPARNDLSGMLPPKLAQIMINLAEPKEGTLIYDPFCGSGTVLQEALLMGFDSKGSDISERAIKDSRENLQWLDKNISHGKHWDLEVKDATKLTEKDFPTPIAIVAEPNLGPPQKYIPSETEAKKTLTELEPKYLDFLKTPIPAGTILILALPFFNLKPKPVFLENLIYKAKELGYIVPAYFTYARKNQIIGRMITKFIIPG